METWKWFSAEPEHRREAAERLAASSLTPEEACYLVSYTNEYGSFGAGGEPTWLSLEQATQFAATLMTNKAWGLVTNVTIIRTDKPLSERYQANPVGGPQP